MRDGRTDGASFTLTRNLEPPLALCPSRDPLFLLHPFLRKAMISSSLANLPVHGSGGYARAGDVQLQPQAVSLCLLPLVLSLEQLVSSSLFREEMPHSSSRSVMNVSQEKYSSYLFRPFDRSDGYTRTHSSRPHPRFPLTASSLGPHRHTHSTRKKKGRTTFPRRHPNLLSPASRLTDSSIDCVTAVRTGRPETWVRGGREKVDLPEKIVTTAHFDRRNCLFPIL